MKTLTAWQNPERDHSLVGGSLLATGPLRCRRLELSRSGWERAVRGMGDILGGLGFGSGGGGEGRGMEQLIDRDDEWGLWEW